MKFWVLKICLVCFVGSFALAEDKIYSSNTTHTSQIIYNQDKVTINAGVKVTYNSWADFRGSRFENNGEIDKGESSGANFTNNVGATFINNGKMTMGQFSNSGTAIFYSNATALCSAGCKGFRNTKGGTFYIIGAILTGDFEMADAFSWNPQPNPPQNTLVFGICDLSNSAKCGSTMGKINGNFTNASKNGVVKVNIANMIYGQRYTIITGTISGIDTIGFLGANLDEVTTHYDIAKGEVWIEKKSTQPDKPDPNPDPDKPNPNPDNPTPPPPSLMHRA